MSKFDRCREIDTNYARQVWTQDVEASIKALGMAALELVTLADASFNAIVRAHPLEALAIIETGTQDEMEVGLARLPEDVLAQHMAFTYGGFDADELLEMPMEERRTFVGVMSDIPSDMFDELTAEQMGQYYEYFINGESREMALVLVLANARLAGSGVEICPSAPTGSNSVELISTKSV